MKTPEELNEKWQDIGQRLTMFAVGEFERQTKFIYNKWKNGDILSANEKGMYLEFLEQNKDHVDLKKMLYEYMRVTLPCYDKVLEMVNGYPALDRIELLQWVLDNCFDETEELSVGDKTFRQAISKRISMIKLEYNLI